MNRYNPNFKVLKPRTYGVKIRPLKGKNNVEKIKKLEDKKLVKQLQLRLKQRTSTSNTQVSFIILKYIINLFIGK